MQLIHDKANEDMQAQSAQGQAMEAALQRANEEMQGYKSQSEGGLKLMATAASQQSLA